jgi:hypothetical protein
LIQFTNTGYIKLWTCSWISFQYNLCWNLNLLLIQIIWNLC